jgi:energy-coupling factor transport system substrate-specific component
VEEPMEVQSTPRGDLWKVTTRAVVYMAIGAALYAAFNLVTNRIVIPGAQNVSLRPGIVIPIFFGVLFGPIVGFFVGLVGNFISDLLTYGFFWNWTLGNGLIGFVAGLTPMVVAGAYRKWPNMVAAAVMSAIGILVGIGFAAITDIWVSKMTAGAVFSTEWLPAAGWDLAWGIPLLIILLIAWSRMRERASR